MLLQSYFVTLFCVNFNLLSQPFNFSRMTSVAKNPVTQQVCLLVIFKLNRFKMRTAVEMDYEPDLSSMTSH